MMMHGLANPEFINSKQAGDIYVYFVRACCLMVQFYGRIDWHDFLKPCFVYDGRRSLWASVPLSL